MNSNKDFQLAIPTKVVTFGDSFTIVVYAAVQSYLNSNNGYVLVTPEQVAYELKVTFPLQHKKRQDIINAFKNLCDLELFRSDKNFYYVNTDIFYKYDSYTPCSYYDVFNIIKNKPGLFHHYLLIKKGMINGQCNYCVEYFMKEENVSKRTIARRTQDLVDLKLISVHQVLFEFKDGQHWKNIYTLYNAQDNFKDQENLGNLNRSISQRYNSFVKNPDKFTPLMRKTLHKQVEEYNRRNPDRAKDLTAFDIEIN